MAGSLFVYKGWSLALKANSYYEAQGGYNVCHLFRFSHINLLTGGIKLLPCRQFYRRDLLTGAKDLGVLSGIVQTLGRTKWGYVENN